MGQLYEKILIYHSTLKGMQWKQFLIYIQDNLELWKMEYEFMNKVYYKDKNLYQIEQDLLYEYWKVKHLLIQEQQHQTQHYHELM